MQVILKYWKAKSVTVLLALAATLGGWVALAWPEPSATASPPVDEVEVAGALQYLAAVDAARQAAAAPRPEVRQVVVVTRPVPAEEIVVVVGADGQPLPIGVPPAAIAEPAPAPVAPAAPRPQPAAPRQPSPPPPQAPAPSAPPAPAPEPKKPPAPAPTASKGS